MINTHRIFCKCWTRPPLSLELWPSPGGGRKGLAVINPKSLWKSGHLGFISQLGLVSLGGFLCEDGHIPSPGFDSFCVQNGEKSKKSNFKSVLEGTVRQADICPHVGTVLECQTQSCSQIFASKAESVLVLSGCFTRLCWHDSQTFVVWLFTDFLELFTSWPLFCDLCRWNYMLIHLRSLLLSSVWEERLW